MEFTIKTTFQLFYTDTFKQTNKKNPASYMWWGPNNKTKRKKNQTHRRKTDKNRTIRESTLLNIFCTFKKFQSTFGNLSFDPQVTFQVPSRHWAAGFPRHATLVNTPNLDCLNPIPTTRLPFPCLPTKKADPQRAVSFQ